MKKPIYQLLITNYLSLVLALLTIGYWLLTPATFAQTNTHVILTWQANNFYPANYLGKPLPTPNTSVTVAAEILENNKLIDLSRADFLWYADEKIIARGIGIKEANFTGKKTQGDDYFVRVVINQNNKKRESSIRIPAFKQLVVIETPSRTVNAVSQILLQAVPYFFNISSFEDLAFSWSVNDKRTSGSENQLLIKVGTPATGSQSIIQVTVSAQNRRNQLEFANDKAKLFIVK